MNKDNEIFLPVVNYEGIYEISNYGKLKRVLQGRGTRIYPKGSISKQGYLRYKLSVNDECVNIFSHCLVAQSFIPNPQSKPYINHIDGNPLNNHVSNLEWCTAKENTQHAFAIGLSTHKGVKNSKCKISEKDVIDIFLSDLPYKELCKKYPIGDCAIRDIKKKRNWTHITANL